MKSTKLALLAAIVCLLSSCQGDPITTTTAGDGFQIELLFEHDGCKMYRFDEGGHSIYWSTCAGTTQYNTGGKTSHRIGVDTQLVSDSLRVFVSEYKQSAQ